MVHSQKELLGIFTNISVKGMARRNSEETFLLFRRLFELSELWGCFQKKE
jgi:hypothetical protein